MNISHSRCKGFTLVELVMIVLIMGIIAAVVVPRIFDASDDATAAAAARVVSMVRDAIDISFAENGAYPPTIDPAWFHGPLKNPCDPENPTLLKLQNIPGKLYPTNKVVVPGASTAFWYNQANGAFMARVPNQATDAETMDLFNAVNNTDITSLDQQQ